MRPNLNNLASSMPNCPPKKNKKSSFFLLTVLSFALKWARPKGRFTMKAQDIIKKLNGGKIRTVTMKRVVPVKETVTKAGNNPGLIEKKTVMQVRGGVEYENLSKVKAKRDAGIERTDKPSPYKLADGFERTILEHKSTGQQYAALAPLNNGFGSTQYLLDGEPVEFEAIKPFIYAQSKSKGGDWMVVKTETIKEIS